jgi:5'-deoxynucleotidase YfbR-like HD superfamily hydrolase
MADTLPELIKNGNDVSRWHTFACNRPQNLAGHSWGVAMMISRLFDGPHADQLLLLKCALEHDLAEKHIGDMPRPGRTQAHRDFEVHVAGVIGIRHEESLPFHLQPWLKWADLIEAGLYSQREATLGNGNFTEVLLRVSNYLTEAEEVVPPPLFQFAREAGLIL